MLSISWQEHRTNDSILTELGHGKSGKAETTIFGHITLGSAGQLALTVSEGIMEGLRHQGRPRRQWIHDIEEWTGCEYIQLKEMSKIEHNGEERYRSGHLLSPTLIEEGRLVSE